MTEEKPISKELHDELLDLFKMCLKDHTDGLTLTFVYPHAKFNVDITFSGEVRNDN